MMNVDVSRLPEPMRRRLEELNAQAPLDHVRTFMLGTFSAAQTLEEVRRDLTNIAASGTRGLQRDLNALEEVLASPLPEGTLAELVGWVGNWVLEDPSDAGARRFLLDVSEMLREVIAAAPPPRRPRRGPGQ
jgi:hypothetical protein